MTAWRIEMRAADGWNAPRNYFLARIVLAPGVYVDAERNPYTHGRWRPAVYVGPDDAEERTAFCLGEIEHPTDHIQRVFDEIDAFHGPYEFDQWIPGTRASLSGAVR